MSDNLSREAGTREERMAAKLRENLRRRKAQAREMGQSDTASKMADKSGQ
ncbi:hypothetical protein ACFCW2_05905 [Qipengyuania sp. DSG2-2]